MRNTISSMTLLLCLVVIIQEGQGRVVVKRAAHYVIDQKALKDMTDHSIYRDKRKVEVVNGVKNAVLGFVFNKINSFIDHKTAWIDQLDKTNIAKNAAHNIYPPKDPVISLSSLISGAIGEKLQAAAPLLQIVTNKISGASSGTHKGFNFGNLLHKGFGSSSGYGGNANYGVSASVDATAHGAAI